MVNSKQFPAFSSVAVANDLVRRAHDCGQRDLSANKMHDLVYIAHGWHLGLTGHPLVLDRPMANVDGVFLPDLREAGCWGARRIDEPIAEVVLDEARGVMVEVAPSIPERAPVRAVIARVWALWGGVSSYDLRNFTREVGAPWDLIWNDEDRPDDEPQSLPSGTVRLWFRDYVESEERKAALIRRQRNDMGDTQKLLARPDPGRLRVV